tara:strand:- start:67 stop:402 length:336 start_codon:yes stop_codon:yes gene_type:complete
MILSVWSDDEMLSDYFIEDICDGVRLVHIVSSEPDEIPLVNVISRRKTLQGNMKNISNLSLMITFNVLMCVVNLYLSFVSFTENRLYYIPTNDIPEDANTFSNYLLRKYIL